MRRADNLTTFMCRLSWNLGASTSWNPQGLSRPVMGLLYLYLSTSYFFTLSFLHSFLLSFLQFFHVRTFPSYPFDLSLISFVPLFHSPFLPELSNSGSFSGPIPTFLWEWVNKNTTTVETVGARPKFEFWIQHKFKRVQSCVFNLQSCKTVNFASTKYTTDT